MALMRPQDAQAFSAVAKQLGLWILVRRTNPASLDFIGRPGFVPKPIDCKAKTADVGPCAGLVVNPEVLQNAFNPAKVPKAMKEWKKFCAEGLIGGSGARYGTQSDPNKPYYGALLLGGDFVHGDYDLYDIIDPDQASRNLAAVETMLGQPHRRGANFYRVQQLINQKIGAPMVQHGGEAQYADHSEQALDAFGPAGEECTILNEFSVRGWYEQSFGGRKTLG
jgi:hypothetical protein